MLAPTMSCQNALWPPLHHEPDAAVEVKDTPPNERRILYCFRNPRLPATQVETDRQPDVAQEHAGSPQ